MTTNTNDELYQLAPIVHLTMVRDAEVEVPAIRNPTDISSLLMTRYGMVDRELLIGILMDARSCVIAVQVLAVGSLNHNLIAMREVFKSAVLADAATMIIAHNHPSGDITPSSEDVAFTVKLNKAAKLLDIKLLDHIVFSGCSFLSMNERGLGEFSGCSLGIL